MRRPGPDGVALKMFLTLHWAASARGPKTGEFAATWAASDYATLLGLDDPHERGARRVREALTSLAKANLIRRSGSFKVELLSEDGSGLPYVPAHETAKGTSGYFSLGPGFWNQGWIAFLSPRAVAVYVAFVALDKRYHFLNEGALRSRIGFSPEVLTQGRAELADAGLIDVWWSKEAAAFSATPSRYRNHRVRPDGLERPPQLSLGVEP